MAGAAAPAGFSLLRRCRAERCLNPSLLSLAQSSPGSIRKEGLLGLSQKESLLCIPGEDQELVSCGDSSDVKTKAIPWVGDGQGSGSEQISCQETWARGLAVLKLECEEDQASSLARPCQATLILGSPLQTTLG